VGREDKPKDEGTPWGEQDELDATLLARSGARANANAAVRDHPEAPAAYDFVFDEPQIDFVALAKIDGDDDLSRCVRVR
jgi:hypothetical protein